MAAFTYEAINAQGLESSGVIHAPDPSTASELLQARGLLAQLTRRARRGGRGRAALQVQEGQAEVAADLRAPAGDDDRGGRERRPGPRHARGADRRRLPRRDARRRALGRRVGPRAVACARPASEGVRPALRLDGRGGRVVGHARRGARPGRDADREGDAAEAARAGRDGLPGRRDQLRDARADLHAPLHHPRLRQRVRGPGRRAADADAVGHARLGSDARLLVHHLPGHVRRLLRRAEAEAHRAGQPEAGTASSSRSR